MTPAAQQPDKDLDTIRDFIVMASDWEAQQEMALDALHRIRSRPAPQPEYIITPEHPKRKYILHPTWKRKLRAIMYDNPALMCPYCGDVDVYLDETCDKCGREVLPCGQVFVDG